MRTVMISALLLLTGNSAHMYAQCTGIGNSLATSYTSNNGSRGAMFNITATNTVTIHCFDANLYGGTTARYEIYYKAGTYVGSETNAAAWTMAGGVNSLYVSANNVPTAIPITIDVVIPAGQTYGFYVTNTASGGLNYISSAVTNVTLASDANMTVTGGVGKAYPFSSTYSYRLFNGTVHYSVGNVLPVDVSSFHATPLPENAVKLDWITESERNNDFFTIEHSADGGDWDKIGEVKGAGNSNTQLLYEWTDYSPTNGMSYYRLQQTDYDGASTYQDPVAVFREEITNGKLDVSPNPANDYFVIRASEDDASELTFTDLLGRNISDQLDLTFTQGEIYVRSKRVATELIVVRSGDLSTLVVLTD